MKYKLNLKIAAPLLLISTLSIIATFQMEIRLKVLGIILPIYAILLPLICILIYWFYTRLPNNKKFTALFLKWSSIIFIIFMIYFWSIPVFIMKSQRNLIKYDNSDVSKHKVAIVFGAGVYKDGTPMPVLEDRLITAAELYEENKAEIIFVSGDNRFDHYNEPEAMKKYLIEEKEIPEKKIVMDFAGRRTYDTCIRANNLWNINRAILVTQEYHLYRSTLLCENAGMKVTGIDAAKREYQGNFIYKSRELFALHKAIIDLYIKKPNYVGGEFEEDLGDLYFEP